MNFKKFFDNTNSPVLQDLYSQFEDILTSIEDEYNAFVKEQDEKLATVTISTSDDNNLATAKVSGKGLHEVLLSDQAFKADQETVSKAIVQAVKEAYANMTSIYKTYDQKLFAKEDELSIRLQREIKERRESQLEVEKDKLN